MDRPKFLKQHVSSNGRDIVAAFRMLSKDDATEIDKWLLIASSSGSMSASEYHLFSWINDQDELGA